MRVEFRRGEGMRYTVYVHRPDGVVVSLPGAGRKSAVPHDLAHVATERSLGMAGGVFGSVAAGAMFGGMAVVSGRLRADPKRRSDAVLRANTRTRAITVAEVMASLVQDVVQHRSSADRLYARAAEAWGTVREDRFPHTAAQLAAAVADLRTEGERWSCTPVGGVLDLAWPDELVLPVRPLATRPATAGARPRPGSRRRERRRLARGRGGR